jgi:LAS superfamily LD-carboxypeptidase LdcB
MHKEAFKAFKTMYFDAKKCGIHLTILSATRNFDRQKSIWEKKWNLAENKSLSPTERAKTILKYSSMPGSSRHHWGTDIDLNALNNEYFATAEGKAVYTWLLQHAEKYGFAQPYTAKSKGRTGYEEEKWHWSYRPLSDPYLQAYNNSIKNEDLTGFSGSEQAVVLDVVGNFVNGIY